MAKQLIMLRSITYAYKARDYLSRRGITAHIQRTPAAYSKCGCGYSIWTKQEPEMIQAMLGQVGIKVVGIAEAD
ncbi:MAG: DUF3343 domain-containing protein [Oscillospiraceae bacterium]|nr:DUF3343 domain-containing protein [Oscillospiraceae bacterium]